MVIYLCQGGVASEFHSDTLLPKGALALGWLAHRCAVPPLRERAYSSEERAARARPHVEGDADAALAIHAALAAAVAAATTAVGTCTRGSRTTVLAGFWCSGQQVLVFSSTGARRGFLVLSSFGFLACTHAVYRRLACGVHAAAPVNGVRAER